MNKALTTIIAACMTPLCALAQETATIDGIRYYLAGGEATVMAQTEQLKGDIIIPETVNYEGAVFTVTSLSHSAFKDQGRIKNITLPNSIKVMGNSCFSGCGSLESIKLPEDITTLGEYSFQNCGLLETLTLPENLTAIGEFCMSGCHSLTSIEIPDGVTSIGSYAFYVCSNMRSVKLPVGITSIPEACFMGCDAIETIDVPYGVTALEDECFSGCKSLAEVSLPNSLTKLGRACFNECSNLKNIILPNSVTSVEEECFNQCEGLEWAILSNALTTLGNRCFYSCEKLKSITLPESMESLGNDCFHDCTLLETISFPESLKWFGGACFKECSSLANVYCKWDEPTDVHVAAIDFEGIFTEAILHVPEGTAKAYKATEPWNQFKYIIEDGKPVTIEKCATPEISYRDKQLTFTSATEGAQYHYTITADDATSAEAYTETGTVTLAAAYGISVYASAEGYANSDAATATLYFFDGSFDATAIAAPEARRALLVTADGRTLTVSGLADGETATLYSLQGTALDTARAAAGQARLDTRGEKGVVILKAGADTIKLSVK